MPLVSSSVAIDDLSAVVVTIDKNKLRADLDDPDEDIRHAAVRLATRMGEAEVLARRLERESDAGLRETILTSLARIGGVKAARPLLRILRSDDALLRNAVIETLQSMGEAVAEEIETLLDDEDPDLRIYGVYIIQAMRSPRVPDIALKVAAADPHVNVCAAAVDVLAEVGRPEMAHQLRAVAERFPDHPFLGFAVRAAIKRIGEVLAIPAYTSVSQPIISDEAFLKFRDFFYRKTGMMFADNKRYFVDKRLQERMVAVGMTDFRQYFDMVCFRADGLELQALVNAMTVNETYFYREEYQLKCLVTSILPEVVKSLDRRGFLRIWSMPCSTGEEPYSIALYLLEHWRRVDEFNIEIVASDIDTEVLKRAKLGIYAERSLQYVSPPTIAKYMTRLPDGNHQIIEELRNSIRFTRANLMEAINDKTYRGFSVVFCRNLLIYFDDVSRREAAEAIYTALNPRGFVCLGHSESMSRISSLFELRKFSEAIVYQKPARAGH